MKKRYYFLFLFVLLAFSCDWDIVDKKYNNYKEAMKDNYLDKGWMPKELFVKSAFNIYHRSELDTNKFWIKYNVSYEDFQEIRDKLTLLDNIDFNATLNKNTPEWWIKNFEGLNLYIFYSNEGRKYHFIINDKDKLIYGFLEKY